MNRIEFMNQLRALLTDLPVNEREEALTYYENYFEDAGADNEARIIREFGSPGRLAAIIREEVYGGEIPTEEHDTLSDPSRQDDKNHAAAGSETNENGETEPFAKQPQMIPYEERIKKAEEKSKEKRKQNTERVLLIVLLCILGFPAIIASGSSMIGVLFGLGGAVFGCIIGGIFIIGAGIASLFSMPEVGVALIGSGFLVIGIGFIILSVVLLVFGVLLPKFIRWIQKKIRGNEHRAEIKA